MAKQRYTVAITLTYMMYRPLCSVQPDLNVMLLHLHVNVKIHERLHIVNRQFNPLKCPQKLSYHNTHDFTIILPPQPTACKPEMWVHNDAMRTSNKAE